MNSNASLLVPITLAVIGLSHSAFGADPAPATDSLTLNQVIQQVVQNNDRIAAAHFMQEAAERKAASTGVWDDPMLMIGLQNSPTDFDLDMDPMTMKMIGISQSIPYSGYKGLERKAAEADALAAAETRRETEVDLVAAARTAFFELFYAQQNLGELHAQREILEQVLASTTAKLRTNQAGQDEVLSAQTEIWRLETTILSTEQEITAASARLNSLCGLNPSDPLPPLATPTTPPLPNSPDDWIAAAEQNYPPLARLNHQAESYDLSAAASRRMAWPMLNLEASYGLRSGYDITHTGAEEPRDNMVSFQATVSLPIFGRGRQRQMARSMQAMQRSTQSDAEQLRRDIQADLTALHQRAQRLSQTLDTYRNRIIPATEDAFRSALAGYTANRTTFASLSSYSLSLYRDRITANQIANELARTLAEVDRYTRGTTEWSANESDSD